MGMRRFSLVLPFLLLPAEALADSHKDELFSGFAYGNGSNLWGGQFSYARMLPIDQTKKTGRVGLFGDFSLVSGPHHDGFNRTQIALMGGVRWQKRRVAGRLMPFLHAEVALVQTRDPAADSPDWAGGPGLGGGLDCLFNEHLVVRVQADHVWLQWSESTVKDYARYSGGIVIRFERHDKSGAAGPRRTR